LGKLLLDIFDRGLREIRGMVMAALRSEPKHQEPGTATEFQNAIGLKREDTLHGVVHPLAHLLRWNRQAGVAAVPANRMEGPVRRRRAFLIGLIPCRFPLLNLLALLLLGAGRTSAHGFRTWHYISDNLLVS